jgi:hypothetical protein
MNSKKVGLWKMNRSLEGTNWRWKQAECLARACGPHTFGNSDELSSRTAKYLDLCRGGDDGPSPASERFPEVATAIRLWNDPPTSEQLRILVIANCERDEIAARLQIDEQVVATIEGLFFDVRWALGGSDWIVCHVIIPEMRAGAFDLAAKLKLAFFGGPVMARAILDARVRAPFEEAGRLFDREVLLQLKLQEALEAPLGEGERLGFLRLYFQYDLSRRRLDLEKQKFAHQCEQAERQKQAEEQPQETAVDESREDGPEPGSEWQLTDDDHPVVTKDILERLVA